MWIVLQCTAGTYSLLRRESRGIISSSNYQVLYCTDQIWTMYTFEVEQNRDKVEQNRDKPIYGYDGPSL